MSQHIKAHRTLRRHHGLVEIVQPIGGYRDYSDRPMATIDPAKPRPMATPDRSINAYALAGALLLAATIAALALAG